MNRDMRSELLAAATGASSRKEDGSIVQSFCLDETFIGFSGHFPGYPIVPAVTQLLAARLLIEHEAGTPLELQKVSHAKFLQQLLPGQPFCISCKVKSDRPLCYDVRIHLGEELASSFKFEFVPGEEHHG